MPISVTTALIKLRWSLWEIWRFLNITQKNKKKQKQNKKTKGKEKLMQQNRNVSGWWTVWVPLRHDYSVFKWIVSCPPRPSPQARSSGQVTARRNVSHVPNASWTVAASSVNLASYSGRKSPLVQLAFPFFKNLFYHLNGLKDLEIINTFHTVCVMVRYYSRFGCKSWVREIYTWSIFFWSILPRYYQ